MKVVTSCPLGHKCEHVTTEDSGEQVMNRCSWYVKIAGQDKLGNQHDDWNCSIAWSPILQIEMAGTNRGQTAALESFRNEVVKTNNVTNKLLSSSVGLQPPTSSTQHNIKTISMDI